MDMKQFDIYLVNLDPTIGSEIKKTRSAVIVSPASMNKYLQTVIVAPLTHTVKGYPSRVSGLFQSQPGDIALDQIRSMDKQRLLHRVGTVDVQTGGDFKKVLQTMFS